MIWHKIIAGSANGRPSPSGGEYLGSNPSPAVTLRPLRRKRGNIKNETKMSEKISTPEHRDRRAEFMVRFLDLAEHVESFRGKKAEEIFGSEKERREFLRNLDESHFFDLLNGTNGILRNKEKEEWKIDGEGVELTGFSGKQIPPRQEDKEPLLQKAFEEARVMNQSGRSLEDIALLLAASINEIHPYADANGRTSRFIYTLLYKGYREETKTEIKNVLGEYGRDVIDVDPSILAKELHDLLADEVGVSNSEKNPQNIKNVFNDAPLDRSQFRVEVPETLQDELLYAIRYGSFYLNLSAFVFVHQYPKIEKYLRSFPTHATIILDKLLPGLGEEDVKNILETYWRLKRRYAELLIDSIAHPEKSEYTKGEAQSLLVRLKAGIKMKQQENQ